MTPIDFDAWWAQHGTKFSELLELMNNSAILHDKIKDKCRQAFQAGQASTGNRLAKKLKEQEDK